MTVRFELVPNWEKCPNGPEYAHEDVAAVACDSKDRVYLHTRKGERVMVYTENGDFIKKWGDGVFNRAHGVTIHKDTVYVTDDGASVVRVFDLNGNFKSMLGTPNEVSDTGYQTRPHPPKIHHNEFVVRAAGPFNCCCNVCVTNNGDIFVADGYGNARIHHFSADGTLQNSWGNVGTGPGQFHLPHGIAIDSGENIIVCDRENDRLQFFDQSGKFLYLWTDVQRPDSCRGRQGRTDLRLRALATSREGTRLLRARLSAEGPTGPHDGLLPGRQDCRTLGRRQRETLRAG